MIRRLIVSFPNGYLIASGKFAAMNIFILHKGHTGLWCDMDI